MRGGIGSTLAAGFPFVVYGQVSGLGRILTDGFGEPARGLLGNIFLEGTRAADGRQDLADRVGAQRTVPCSALQGADDILGIEAGAKAEDDTSLMQIDARRALAHEPEELRGALAHAVECLA